MPNLKQDALKMEMDALVGEINGIDMEEEIAAVERKARARCEEMKRPKEAVKRTWRPKAKKKKKRRL